MHTCMLARDLAARLAQVSATASSSSLQPYIELLSEQQDNVSSSASTSALEQSSPEVPSPLAALVEAGATSKAGIL